MQLDDVSFVVPVAAEWKTLSQVPLADQLLLDYEPGDPNRLEMMMTMVQSTEHGGAAEIERVPASLRRALEATVHIAVVVTRDEDDNEDAGLRMYAQAIASAIHSAGYEEVSLVDVVWSSHEVVLSVQKSKLIEVSALLLRSNRVMAVFEKPRSRVMNSTGNKIVTTGSPTSPTNPYAGLLDGTGEIIHIADSGLDFYHCFFHDTVSPKTSKTMVMTAEAERAARRKVVAYWQFMDGAWSWADHGTHVAGTAAGAAANSILSLENGLASGAKIAFTDIGCQTAGGCTCGQTSSGSVLPCDCGSGKCAESDSSVYVPTSLDTALFPYGLANDAFISSNSWGGGSSYGSSSRQIDSAAYQNSSLVILFAAGNAGDGQTVSQQGEAKNAITVGASMTGRDDMIDIVQNKVDPSHDGGFAYATQILNCAPSDVATRDDCAYFMNENFDACSTSGYCSAGSSSGISGCGCIPCVGSNCYLIGRSYCASCVVVSYQNTPETNLSPWSLAIFSSTGPATDGRIKPDVVAPGYLIASSRAYPGSLASSADVCGTSGRYASFSTPKPHLFATQGTSMSTPLVAGYATLVRQYVRTYYPNAAGTTAGATPISSPPSSLIKALIIQSATPLNGIYCAGSKGNNCNNPQSLNYGRPYQQGFGRVDLRTIIPLPTGSEFGTTRILAYEDGANGVLATSGATASFSVNVTAGQCLRVTLVWTDAVASSSAAVQLVNDLDLIVSGDDGSTIYGNEQYFKTVDRTNNVEKVMIPSIPPPPSSPSPSSSATYSIKVSAYRVTTPQGFSLVASTMPSTLCVEVSAADAEGPNSASPSATLVFTTTLSILAILNLFFIL
eukprot:ANDGO_03013.mRNA.1 Serine protease/ABC transporter B family protein tagD